MTARPAPAGPDERVAAFLRSRSGGSADTVRTYGKRLARYVRAAGSSDVDRDRYDRYVTGMKRQGRRPNGIALDSRIVLLYAEFCGVDTKGWQRPQSRETPTAYLKEPEYEALRAALLASPRDGEDRAFLADFLRGTGLRLGEAMALRWRDVDLEAGTVTVRSGKGGKMRVVPIPWEGPPAMVRALEEAQRAFFRRHPEKTLGEARLVPDRVFPWENWYDVENLLKAAAKRARLTGLEVHPHVFRHTFAVDLTMRGVPQAVIQRLLGHANPATTSRYQQVAPVDIFDALRAAAGS